MELNNYTGLGQTLIAEEEKSGLKAKAITLQSELDRLELTNIIQAKRWLRRQRPDLGRVLSESFIKQTHQKMFGDVWSWAGKFRRTEKNIGVSWVRIGREVKVLCDDTHFWVAQEVFPPVEIALRFKHRLVSIHCFPNGNGRHSRIMADVIVEKLFGMEPFSWQAEGMISADEERKLYIASLRAADGGNIQPLLSFAAGR